MVHIVNNFINFPLNTHTTAKKSTVINKFIRNYRILPVDRPVANDGPNSLEILVLSILGTPSIQSTCVDLIRFACSLSDWLALRFPVN